MTPDLDSNDIARYLLGQLPDSEADALEQEYMTSDDAHALFRAVEDELFDSYAAGTMSDARRGQFEARFLADKAGRERVLFARALLARASGSPQASEPATSAPRASALERFRAWLRGGGWAVAGATVAAVALAIVLVSRPGDAPQKLAVADVSLRATTVRSTGDTPVAPSGRPLRLRLELDPEESFPRYEVAVDVNGHRRVLGQGAPTGGALVLNIEGGVLPSGRYELELTGIDASGTAGDSRPRREVVGYYAIAVAAQ